jgi:hypothetical protein
LFTISPIFWQSFKKNFAKQQKLSKNRKNNSKNEKNGKIKTSKENQQKQFETIYIYTSNLLLYILLQKH